MVKGSGKTTKPKKLTLKETHEQEIAALNRHIDNNYQLWQEEREDKKERQQDIRKLRERCEELEKRIDFLRNDNERLRHENGMLRGWQACIRESRDGYAGNVQCGTIEKALHEPMCGHYSPSQDHCNENLFVNRNKRS